MNQGESGETIAVDDSRDYTGEGTMADKPEAEPEDQEATPTNTDSSEAKKPRRGGFQKKIERANARIAELEAIVAKAQHSETDKAQAVEPQSEDYPTEADYQKALRAYDKEQIKAQAVKEAIDTLKQESSKEVQEKEYASKLELYNERLDIVRDLYEDYDEVMEAFRHVKVRKEIHEVLFESEFGPDISYYLGTNSDAFKKVNDPKISVYSLNKELAKIESLIEGNKKVKKAAVRTTSSPPPIVPVKSKASTFSRPEDTTGDYESYRKARGFN